MQKNSSSPSSPSREGVFDMFNAISPTYDRVNQVMTFGIDRFFRKKLTKQLPQQKGLKVLDAATGTADQILSILKQRPDIASIIGIDLAKAMVDIGRKKTSFHPLKEKISFQIASLLELPFDESTFDVVTIAFGIRNVLDPIKALMECFRVLKPNGKILILEGTIPSHRLLKTLHLFYLRHLLPWIGGILSNHQQAYRYLNQTIETFPQNQAFCALLETAGFLDCQIDPLLKGAATIYSGKKSGLT